MDTTMGRLVYLPAGVAGPDPDAFLSDVLTGWRRAQLAQTFSPDTVRRRVPSVLRMGDFVDSYPWQWTAADADDFFGRPGAGACADVDSARTFVYRIQIHCTD